MKSTNKEYADHFGNVANLFLMLSKIITEEKDCNPDLINSAERSIAYLKQHIDDDKLSDILETIERWVNENCYPLMIQPVATVLDKDTLDVSVNFDNETSESMHDVSCSPKNLEKLNNSFEVMRKKHS